MDENLKRYEKSITKKHSWGWTPKFVEEFRTTLNQKIFIPIAEQAIQKLHWDLIYKDEKTIEARRSFSSLGLNKWTESISITYNHGKVTVKSESLGNEVWDNGRNSKRVRLFIHAFKEIEKNLDSESQRQIEIEVDKQNNWDDYVLPDKLPQPLAIRKPNFFIVVAGGLLTSILLALILAKLSVDGIYIIGLFEFGVALAIGFSFKYLIKFSNYTIYNNLYYVMIGIVGLTYLLNQYFQYEMILRANGFDRMGFIEFLQMRLEYGLTIKDLNTGWIGLVVSWILQLVFTYFVALSRLVTVLTAYQMEKVPPETIDFAYYHLLKGKSEQEVRNELSAKGWTQKEHQDDVFEAISALYGAIEMNRL